MWLVDPVDWPRRSTGRTLGEPAGVLQLLNRHDRDCAEIAERLAIPHLRCPRHVPGSPFEITQLKRSRLWREIALWWSERRTLVVADALGTNPFFPNGDDRVGVHPLLKLTPPRKLAAVRAGAPAGRPRHRRPWA